MPGPVRGAALDSFIRNGAVSYFHETCMAKMGRDRMSVVDAKLRVYGVDIDCTGHWHKFFVVDNEAACRTWAKCDLSNS
ncbi:GMC oxidoreductase [Cupriavidus sp. 2MCAB6]|uniref:GMC oxidoreductase n=1 Tax=Cupriavidus sp. 2MCAB6 TaxID=3232981 RepID=UPI003F8F1BB9